MLISIRYKALEYTEQKKLYYQLLIVVSMMTPCGLDRHASKAGLQRNQRAPPLFHKAIDQNHRVGPFIAGHLRNVTIYKNTEYFLREIRFLN